MNFSPDAPVLETTPARRDDTQSQRVHYTNEFSIYQKPRPNGHGVTKRARCNHCNGDWAYNETRLKHHIIDPYRGCRRIPPEARDRVRTASESANNPAVASSASLPPTSAPAGTTQPPPAKRKREPSTVATPIQNQPVVPVSAEPDLPMGIGTASEAQNAQVRVAVEFSMTSGTLLRATWIASELITEFHREIVDVGLIPRSSENTFNIWIGGKIAWSRGVGQPLPDYDHLRPIVQSAICQVATGYASQICDKDV